jgi:hypothetical protein
MGWKGRHDKMGDGDRGIEEQTINCEEYGVM